MHTVMALDSGMVVSLEEDPFLSACQIAALCMLIYGILLIIYTLDLLTIAYSEATDSSPIFMREVLVGLEIVPRSSYRWMMYILTDSCLPVNLGVLWLQVMRDSIGF